jgi:4-diphosphocytidyl-2-C-methyl-D-erythritol kinase
MPLRRLSPCKVNLLLNILGKRADGFHELETLFHHVPLHDELEFSTSSTSGVQFTCDQPELPVDASNLVVRAAARFLEAARLEGHGVRIHLSKRIPLAAGLGGGSSNAAHTLLGLNKLLGFPLDSGTLDGLAASLGSDVNFFLQDRPALGTGRGDKVAGLEPFPALKGCAMLLFHPGFGISTAWAYGELARYPAALNGKPGRAADLAARFQSGDLVAAGTAMYNSLEAPALHKYPILQLYQEFLREHGAWAALMSGSGSTTFGIFHSRAKADAAVGPFQERFGSTGWLQVVTF